MERTIACVYWEGDFRGRQDVYSVKWVKALQRNIALFCNEPYRFVCLTNVPNKINFCETIALTENWDGWWSKIELFKPNQFTGRVLYIDLDSIVLKSLNPFFDCKGSFVAMGTKSRKNGTFETEHGLIVHHRYSSTLMVWDAGVGCELFTDFDYKKHPKKFRGDQDWLAHKFSNLATFPEPWIEKLRYCVNGKMKPGMKVLLAMDLGMRKKNISAIKKYPKLAKLWKI